MQCPICGSDRNPKDVKCGTCGVDYSKWLKKVINKLNTQTDKVMQSKDIEKKPPPAKHYREVIKMDK